MSCCHGDGSNAHGGVTAADYSLQERQERCHGLRWCLCVCVSLVEIGWRKVGSTSLSVCLLTLPLCSGEELQSCDIWISLGPHTFSSPRPCIHLRRGTPRWITTTSRRSSFSVFWCTQKRSQSLYFIRSAFFSSSFSQTLFRYLSEGLNTILSLNISLIILAERQEETRQIWLRDFLDGVKYWLEGCIKLHPLMCARIMQGVNLKVSLSCCYHLSNAPNFSKRVLVFRDVKSDLAADNVELKTSLH